MAGDLAAPILTVRDLCVGYPVAGRIQCPVKSVSFTLREREVVGLVGDAGSGKSTTALALLGLARAPGRIMGGSVEFGGRDLLQLPDDQIRAIRGRDIGIIVQNPRAALNPMLRIGRQIATAYQAHNTASKAEARAEAIQMLRMVGINDPERRVDSFAHELSGGMAQRALIAMALSSKPKLLIADEPTSGLDVTIQAQFLDEMWASVQAAGSAILLVTQELGVIANYCDRVLVLHDGVIVEDAPVRDFFASPQHPYSRDVLRLYRERGTAWPAQVPAAAPVLLRAAGLTKNFPIRRSTSVVHAVDSVSLSVRKGEALGLVGESGSGKTTVGRCLVRLVEPTSGQILLEETDLAALSRRALRDVRGRIQIVFQDPYDSVDPRWSVADILAEPLTLHSDLDKAARRKKAAETLALVDLPASILDRKPRGLGAGALQRINIARALISAPDFIVLDEPTSVLAPRARNSLIALLARLQMELSISFLFISHDLTTVRYLCQRVAVMYLGQIVEEGTVEQVFTTPRHPYSQALLSAHLFPDPTNRRVDQPARIVLQGEIPSPIDLPKGCYLASRCPHVTEACRSQTQTLSDLGPDLGPDRGHGRRVRCGRVVAGEI